MVMKLSVILPCYNGAKTIAVQLEALARQVTVGDWELVVVNNGSTDDSVAIVESYRARLPQLRLVEAHDPAHPRLPVAHSYNVGIQAATGDAFAFCEADDEVSQHWVAAMAAALQQYPMVAGPLDLDRLNEPWLACAYDGQHQQANGLIYVSHPPQLPFCSGCNLGLQRRVYETVGALDETLRYCYDTDYCWRAQLAGFTLHFVPDALAHYRLRNTLKELFQQGNRWGNEYVRLHKRYGTPFGQFILVKRLTEFCRYAIAAVKLYPMSLLNIRRGRGGFALWVWGAGYQIGEMQGLFHYFCRNGEDDQHYFKLTPLQTDIVRRQAPHLLTQS